MTVSPIQIEQKPPIVEYQTSTMGGFYMNYDYAR